MSQTAEKLLGGALYNDAMKKRGFGSYGRLRWSGSSRKDTVAFPTEHSTEVPLTTEFFQNCMLKLAVEISDIQAVLKRQGSNSELEAKVEQLLDEARELVVRMEVQGVKALAAETGIDISEQLPTIERLIRKTAKAASSYLERLLPSANPGEQSTRVKTDPTLFTVGEVEAAYSLDQRYKVAMVQIFSENGKQGNTVSRIEVNSEEGKKKVAMRYQGDVYGQVDVILNPDTQAIDDNRPSALAWRRKEGNLPVAQSLAGVEAAKGVAALANLLQLEMNEVKAFLSTITSEMIRKWTSSEVVFENDAEKDKKYKMLMLMVVSQAHTAWSSGQAARGLFEQSVISEGEITPENTAEKIAEAALAKLKQRLSSGDYTMINQLNDENQQSHAQVLLKDFHQIHQALQHFDFE